MKDYLTIKEFAKLSGIEQSTLRYWDEIGLFSPTKRDSDNNYRYYSPDQIIAVNFITVMSGLNVPLKKIGDMQKERTPGSIVRLIERQEKLLDMEMRRLRESYSIIHTRLDLIKYGMKLEKGYRVLAGKPVNDWEKTSEGIDVDETKIRVMYREDAAFILGPPNEFKEGEMFYGPFMRFCQKAKDMRINTSYPVGGYHESMDSFLRTPDQPDYFFSLDPTGNRVRPAGNYMVGFCRGPYGQFGDTSEKMAAYAKENGLTVSGPVYTIYLHDEVCIKDRSQYLTQVCVAVSGMKKTKVI